MVLSKFESTKSSTMKSQSRIRTKYLQAKSTIEHYKNMRFRFHNFPEKIRIGMSNNFLQIFFGLTLVSNCRDQLIIFPQHQGVSQKKKVLSVKRKLGKFF